MTPQLLTAHNHCTSCGYCLEGLPESTHCPECNKPCAESIAEAEVAGTMHIKKLWWAAIVATVGALGTFVVFASFFVSELFGGFPSYSVYIKLVWCLHFSVSIASVGWFLLARKSRPQDPTQAANTLRLWSRWSTATILLAHAVSYFVIPNAPWSTTAVAMALQWCLFTLPAAFFLLTTTAYASAILNRLPTKKRLARVRVCFWIAAVGVPLFGAALAVRLWKSGSGGGSYSDAIEQVLMYSTYIPYLSAFAAHLVVAITLVRSLGRVRRHALRGPRTEPAA